MFICYNGIYNLEKGDYYLYEESKIFIVSCIDSGYIGII